MGCNGCKQRNDDEQQSGDTVYNGDTDHKKAANNKRRRQIAAQRRESKKKVCGANTHRGNSRLYALEKMDAFINPNSPNLGLQSRPQLSRENLMPFGIRNCCRKVTLVDTGIQERNETKKGQLQNKTILMDGIQCSRSYKNIQSGKQIQNQGIIINEGRIGMLTFY